MNRRQNRRSGCRSHSSMKPGFALSLSFEGLTLLHRSASGWRRVGEVAVDTPDMAAAMDGLRRDAAALSRSALRTKLVLPDDQIRYLTIDTGPLDADARREAAIRALDGATPYAVEELAFDIAAEGPKTHVAAVARETLDEAESFAVDHGFNPVSFVAMPDPAAFPGEPFFGETRQAGTLLAPGETVEPDTDPIVLAEMSAAPEGPVAADDAAPVEDVAAPDLPAAAPDAPREAAKTDIRTPEPPAAKDDAPDTAKPAPSPALGRGSVRDFNHDEKTTYSPLELP